MLALRRIRLTAEQIAEQLEMAPSTVSLICKRSCLGRLPRLEPSEPARRYERKRAGELVHIDVKKLGRIGPNGAGHRVTGRWISNRARTDKADLNHLLRTWLWSRRSRVRAPSLTLRLLAFLGRIAGRLSAPCVKKPTEGD